MKNNFEKYMRFVHRIEKRVDLLDFYDGDVLNIAPPSIAHITHEISRSTLSHEICTINFLTILMQQNLDSFTGPILENYEPNYLQKEDIIRLLYEQDHVFPKETRRLTEYKEIKSFDISKIGSGKLRSYNLNIFGLLKYEMYLNLPWRAIKYFSKIFCPKDIFLTTYNHFIYCQEMASRRDAHRTASFNSSSFFYNRYFDLKLKNEKGLSENSLDQIIFEYLDKEFSIYEIENIVFESKYSLIREINLLYKLKSSIEEQLNSFKKDFEEFLHEKHESMDHEIEINKKRSRYENQNITLQYQTQFYTPENRIPLKQHITMKSLQSYMQLIENDIEVIKVDIDDRGLTELLKALNLENEQYYDVFFNLM